MRSQDSMSAFGVKVAQMLRAYSRPLCSKFVKDLQAGMRSINVVGRFRDRRKRMRSAILSRLTAAGDNAGVLAQARMVTLVPSRGSRSLSRSSFWPSEIPPAKAR